jgi:hypothetical protein
MFRNFVSFTNIFKGAATPPVPSVVLELGTQTMVLAILDVIFRTSSFVYFHPVHDAVRHISNSQ